MRIGALAAEAGLTVRMLRHYEAQGLIQSSRKVNGYRDYSSDAIEHVAQIRTLLDCGFSTKQIRGFLPCVGAANFDPQACAAGFKQHIAKLREIDALIDILSKRRCRLSVRIARFGVSSLAEQAGEAEEARC